MASKLLRKTRDAAAEKALVRGQKALAEGRLSSAIAEFEDSLSYNDSLPDALFGLARAADRLGDYRKAADFYGQILYRWPEEVRALANLASVQVRLGEYAAATDGLRQAIAKTPDVPALWLNLARVMLATGDLSNARVFLDEVLRLDGKSAAAFDNLADISREEGDYPAARDHYRRALALAPDDPQLHLNYSILLQTMGCLKECWDHYEWRLDARLSRAIDYRHGLPRWQGGELAGRRLLVCAEQGLGDQIYFAACLGKLAAGGAELTVECAPRLAPLFARSFSGMKIRPDEATSNEGRTIFHYDKGFEGVPPDLYIEIGSLPFFFCREADALTGCQPYLKADSERTERFTSSLAALGPPPWIGLNWRSGKMTAERRREYLALDDLAPLLGRQRATWINLQYDGGQDELAGLAAGRGVTVHNIDGLDQKNDVDGAAALINALDRVIAVPTTVAQIAGALGVPTLKLARERPMTALGREREPFQPSVTPLFPERPGDWPAVLRQLDRHLGELLAA